MSKLTRCFCSTLAVLVVIGAPLRSQTETETDTEAETRADVPWLEHGRTPDEQRFSPLSQINENNVAQLEVAWSYDTGQTRGHEATPIVADGVMYVTASWSIVHAIDLRTGKEKWIFDPEVPRSWGRKACCDVVNRGLALWQGYVFVGTIDGRLVKIDITTGEPAWDKSTIDRSKPYTITGAPRVDYTATQPLMLADLEIEGVERQVLMQAPKNGFFYVLDRKTGELLSAEKYTEAT